MPFDPKTIELEDSNLIEASAGTGKTYSIAIMALRLVVEKDIKINQILMVTFTKAAVAELELRVRAFLRLGLKVVRGEQISDSMIRDIVQEAIENNDIDTIKKRLEEAVLFLDETAVLTIHSFCQKVLKEFSFETNQIFGAEAISPDEFNQLVEDSFNEYWRKKITTLNTKLLTDLLEKGFTRDAILQVVKDGLSGKLPTAPVDVPADFLTPTFQDALLRTKKGGNQTAFTCTIKQLGR
jgi:exodeoxyribonuclease V beta subunit